MLGGAHVFDKVPRAQRAPYIAFAEGELADWSTATEDGAEHLVVLLAVSDMPGRKEVIALAEGVRDVLDNAALILSDHHLVNLQFGSFSVRRNKDGDGYTATVRFRAVTEPQ